MELTQQEQELLEAKDEDQEEEAKEEGVAEEEEKESAGEEEQTSEESKEEGPAEKEETGEEVTVKTKDGKHEIPFEVLAALREENKQLRQLLEQTLSPKKEEQQQEDRFVVDPVTGEKYIPFEKATEDELIAARAKFLEEGNIKTVNQIDVMLQKKHLERATLLASFEASKAEFASKNTWYGKDPMLTKMADDMMLQLDSDPQWRGKTFKEGWEEVAKRLAPYVPIDKDALEKEIMERVAQKLSVKEGKPQEKVSLSGVGSSKSPVPPEDKWAELDAILQKDPARYERAIMKMSAKEYDAYKRRMNRR